MIKDIDEYVRNGDLNPRTLKIDSLRKKKVQCLNFTWLYILLIQSFCIKSIS